MMPEISDLLYKCRHCSEVISHRVTFGPAGNLQSALLYLTADAPIPYGWAEGDGETPRAVETHECGGGVVGVMDLVGGRAAGGSNEEGAG